MGYFLFYGFTYDCLQKAIIRDHFPAEKLQLMAAYNTLEMEFC